MVKVCHVSSAHLADDVRIFQKECRSLQKKGYDVYLVISGESGEKSGVKIHGIGKVPENRIKRMLFHVSGVNHTCIGFMPRFIMDIPLAINFVFTFHLFDDVCLHFHFLSQISIVIAAFFFHSNTSNKSYKL